MSFSTEVKGELCHLPMTDPGENRAELAGLLATAADQTQMVMIRRIADAVGGPQLKHELHQLAAGRLSKEV